MHADFPSNETLAAFIDGRADGETRRRVMEHVATCAECYEVVLAANALREPEPNIVPIPTSRWVVPSLAAAAVIALVALFVSPLRERILPQPKTGLAALAAAAPPQRTVEGRLTGFPYRPLKPVTRGSAEEDDTSPEHLKLLSAAAQVAADAKNNPTPDNLHAYGVSLLMLGRTDAAVSTLEDALRKETGEDQITSAIQKGTDPSLLNDLCVAYGQRSTTEAHASDVLFAVAASERARTIKPQLPDIAWNHALAVERLHIRADAEQAWNDFLKLEPHGKWAEEGRAHLRQLGVQGQAQLPPSPARLLGVANATLTAWKATAARWPEDAADLVQDNLLGVWGEALMQRDPAKAHRALRAAREVATALCAHGTCVDADAVRVIDRAQSARDTHALEFLARGHAHFAEARRLYRARDASRAAASFETAAAELRAANTPFAYVAALGRISSIYIQNRYDDVRDNSRLLARDLPSRYPSLQGRLHWIDGIMALEQGHPFEAFRHFEAARATFADAGEVSNESVMLAFGAEALGYMGERERAWGYRLRALQNIEHAAPVNRHYVLTEAAVASYDDCPPAARVLLNRLITADASSASPAERTTGYIWRAMFNFKTGDRRAALADLRSARAFSAAITDPNVRSRAESNLELAEAIGGSGDAPAANLSAALEYARRSGSNFRTALLYLKRAVAHVNQKDRQHAREDVDAGMQLLESQRTTIRDPVLKATFLDNVRPVVDEVIEALVRSGDADQAFSVMERVRGRILDDLPARPVDVVTVAQLRDKLVDNTVFVEQFLTSSQLIAVVVRRDGIRLVTVNRSAERLREAAEQFCLAVREDAESPDDEQMLRATILDPLLPALDGAQHVVFSTDGPLLGVPYAAIRLADGQRAVEHFAISYAPSASVFVAASAQRPVSDDSGVLIVAAPLPGAIAEANVIAPLYKSIRFLRDQQLSHDAFLSGALQAGILHFAGHTLLNTVRPEFSTLILGRDDQRDGRIYAHEIAALHLLHTRLVVLASCDSALAPMRTAGVNSMAAAFLAAGVPQVIGSLWPVDDRDAGSFAYEFHRRVAAGQPPAAALRDTQQFLMRRIPHRTGTWAAFVLIGGNDRKERS